MVCWGGGGGRGGGRGEVELVTRMYADKLGLTLMLFEDAGEEHTHVITPEGVAELVRVDILVKGVCIHDGVGGVDVAVENMPAT